MTRLHGWHEETHSRAATEDECVPRSRRTATADMSSDQCQRTHDAWWWRAAAAGVRLAVDDGAVNVSPTHRVHTNHVHVKTIELRRSRRE